MFSCFCFKEKNKDTNEDSNEDSNNQVTIYNNNSNDDDDGYDKLYNKLFSVSIEFSKMKQTLTNLMLKDDHKNFEIAQLKKELAYLKNANKLVIKTDDSKSKNENTVVFISVSNLTETKKKIITDIQENNIFKNIVIGIDDKYIQYSDEITNLLVNNNKLIVLSYNKLVNKYTNKINNFNGKWDTNPSKLGAYDWFNGSPYSYMWYIEDDVFSKDWDSFFKYYENNNYDVIFKNSDNFPTWYYDNWKVGSNLHAISLAHLYVHRISKFFSNCLIATIKNEKTTSHHELFIPYVIHRYKCSMLSLNDKHTKYSTTNGTGDNIGFTKKFIDETESNLFHPVKIL